MPPVEQESLFTTEAQSHRENLTNRKTKNEDVLCDLCVSVVKKFCTDLNPKARPDGTTHNNICDSLFIPLMLN